MHHPCHKGQGNYSNQGLCALPSPYRPWHGRATVVPQIIPPCRTAHKVLILESLILLLCRVCHLELHHFPQIPSPPFPKHLSDNAYNLIAMYCLNPYKQHEIKQINQAACELSRSPERWQIVSPVPLELPNIPINSVCTISLKMLYSTLRDR